MHQLVESTLALLWQNSVCQKVKSGIDIEDDDHGHSEMLLDAITDLLPTFSKAMGSDFAPFFEPLFDPLMDLLVSFSKTFSNFTLFSKLIGVLQKESYSPQDRTIVVACLAEVAQHMGTTFSTYVNVIFFWLILIFFVSVKCNKLNIGSISRR